MRRWAVPAAPVRRGAGAVAMFAFVDAPAEPLAPMLLFICPLPIWLFIWLFVWALLFICALVFICAPPLTGPRTPVLLFTVALVSRVAPPPGGTFMGGLVIP